MVQQVIMPKLGQTVEEAVIERWRKSEGDAVSKGEVLLEITTDKATLEVESFFEGTLLKIVYPEGAKVPVNQVIGFVGNPGDPIPEVPAVAAAPRMVAAAPAAGAGQVAEAGGSISVAATPSAPSGRVFVSPRAKARAEESKVPVRVLHGSGPNGRVIEQDVLAYVEKRNALKITPLALNIAYERGIDVLSLKNKEGRIGREDVEAAPAVPEPGAARRVPLSAMRRVIAQRMAESKSTIPHFYLEMDVDMSQAMVLRKELNDAGRAKISFNDMIVRACALGFEKVPAMNVTWGGDALIFRDQVDIGLAVAVEEGLLVPVVRGVGRRALREITAESAALVEKARNKRLTPDDYGNASMTVSNLGMFDVKRVFPIINPGESCILGVGRMAEQVVVVGGGIHIRNIMSLVLAGDHRVVDGAMAAQFLKAVKDALESPSCL